MEEYLIISNTNFMLRVAAQQIAYVCSEGSYCVLRLVDGDEYTFSFNLAVFEKKIVEQLPVGAHSFARVGRNYIINSQYIFSINTNHYCPRDSFNISKSNNLIVTHQN